MHPGTALGRRLLYALCSPFVLPLNLHKGSAASGGEPLAADQPEGQEGNEARTVGTWRIDQLTTSSERVT